ncbi:MAG TPA: hypothetical protein VN280_00445 [Variovorax sp.]|nr:hypothetical protein [Variovorax sp.]
MRAGELSIESIEAAYAVAADSDFAEQRRLEKLMMLHGIDDAVPQAWIDEGRDFIGSGNNREFEPMLRKVLASPALMGKSGIRRINLWEEIDRRIEGSERSKLWGGAVHALAHGRRSILKWCAWRGGPLRAEAPRKVRERRAKLAKLASKLRAAIKADKSLPMDRLSVTEYENRRLGRPQDQHEILPALESLIADLAKITADTRELDPFQPQPGRGTENERRQSLLERRLCSTFEDVTDGPCTNLVALLVGATLDVDEIDPEALAARWRAFRSS